MPEFKAPLRDMKFLMHEVFDYESHYKTCLAAKKPPQTLSMRFWKKARVSLKAKLPR